MSAPRVLSLQSHVVHGYVGNRAAVFPLQLLGFDVDVINSVQFSCHTGYPDFSGQKMTGEELRTLVQGLATNQVLDHSFLLTGYIGTASFLREVVKLRQMLPEACTYVCDPVLGDNGKLYVSEELIEVYRSEVLSHVAVLTPNQFEAELLAERKIGNIQEAAAACDALHKMGPKMIVLTTLDSADATLGGANVAMMLSMVGKPKWLLRLPCIGGGPFTGTGDLTAAMILAWTRRFPLEMPAALEHVGAVLQAVIQKTVSQKEAKIISGKRVPPELSIIDSKRAIEAPLVKLRCQLVDPPRILGVVFDLDAGIEGTLEERSAKLQGLEECIVGLTADGVKLGRMTRNLPETTRVDDLLRYVGLDGGVFAPIVACNPDLAGMPDPAPVLHCCRAWGLEPASVLVVGDHLDDLSSGRAAGSLTVALLLGQEAAAFGSLESQAFQKAKVLSDQADFTVSSFDALIRFFPDL